MLTKRQFKDILDEKKTLIIDGALATEIETRGHDLNHPLWSGKILRDDALAIQDVHYDYFQAGADIAITASYQTSIQGLKESFGVSDDEARDLIKRSVQVAQNARRETGRDGLWVAGSVGPYGAYLHDGSEYRGDYQRTEKEFRDFHRLRIQALLDADVDLIALETIPSFAETKALLNLLKEEFPTAVAWLSFTTKDSGHIADGTPWSEILPILTGQIVAVGVNCVAMAGVTETLREMKTQTGIPLLCYPNSGEVFDSKTNSWSGERFEDGDGRVFETKPWTLNGARLIGGCCRTGPGFIRAVAVDVRGRR